METLETAHGPSEALLDTASEAGLRHVLAQVRDEVLSTVLSPETLTHVHTTQDLQVGTQRGSLVIHAADCLPQDPDEGPRGPVVCESPVECLSALSELRGGTGARVHGCVPGASPLTAAWNRPGGGRTSVSEALEEAAEAHLAERVGEGWPLATLEQAASTLWRRAEAGPTHARLGVEAASALSTLLSPLDAEALARVISVIGSARARNESSGERAPLDLGAPAGVVLAGGPGAALLEAWAEVSLRVTTGVDSVCVLVAAASECETLARAVGAAGLGQACWAEAAPTERSWEWLRDPVALRLAAIEQQERVTDPPWSTQRDCEALEEALETTRCALRS